MDSLNRLYDTHVRAQTRTHTHTNITVLHAHTHTRILHTFCTHLHTFCTHSRILHILTAVEEEGEQNRQKDGAADSS